MRDRIIVLPDARTACCNQWRSLWIALIGVVALAPTVHSRADSNPTTASSESTASLAATTPNTIAQPSPQLSPEDVVQKQMEALSAGGAIETRIDRCYRFASPANRSHTGPLERFATMVQSPSYQAVLNAKHFLVGRATQQKNEAHLIVTTVDPAGELTLFRFFLSKQMKAPYTGCWMTDAVVRVGTMKPPDESRKSQQDSASI